jgi:CRP-like cAMP-binding protein
MAIELTATLRRVPLFHELTEAERQLLAGRTVRKRYGRGALVFSEGDECRELLVVEEGTVRLFKRAPSGREQLIGIERAGSALAETAVFDEGRYSVTACAEEQVVLLSLDAKAFRAICAQNPQVAAKVIKVLAYRLRQLDALVEELSFSTVRGRLMAHLAREAREKGTPTSAGTQFELKENNEELAARLGTVRELISRNLGRLHGDGLIQMRRRTVIIPDMERLESEIDAGP